jgi:hypothetical protein
MVTTPSERELVPTAGTDDNSRESESEAALKVSIICQLILIRRPCSKKQDRFEKEKELIRRQIVSTKGSMERANRTVR